MQRRSVGLRCGDTVSKWVSRFNIEGLASVLPRHGGGAVVQYSEQDSLGGSGACTHRSLRRTVIPKNNGNTHTK